MVKTYKEHASHTLVGFLMPPLNCAASTLWAACLDMIPASIFLGSVCPDRLFIRDFGLPVVPAILNFVWSPHLFVGSFYTLARLHEPSAYRSLLDALLITPVAKPPLLASAPSRKSTSALELPKSKRYCPGGVCGWHLGLRELATPSEHISVVCMLVPVLVFDMTSSKPCWFHLCAHLD